MMWIDPPISAGHGSVAEHARPESRIATAIDIGVQIVVMKGKCERGAWFERLCHMLETADIPSVKCSISLRVSHCPSAPVVAAWTNFELLESFADNRRSHTYRKSISSAYCTLPKRVGR